MESSPMPKIVHLMVQEDSENEVTIIIGEENSFKFQARVKRIKHYRSANTMIKCALSQ